ncbi:hypothetical protein ISN45_Aa01g009520 [Arabidopsis thaliana x Arabidopsis arenosa]|uniref:Uncharacterized protein n=1 Tax=Arabidopsis thaliana x Arabidopsis arenosa TaxID=1240361 RepID=A0A8T2C0K7_9BRAS|nr:hypothetical protein ISN45_Aa01g009520 [Arabidopsis thaliana x Arabidopsis arenosa]
MCIILHSCTARLPHAQNLQIELKQDQKRSSLDSKPIKPNMGGFLAKKNSNSKIRNSFTSKCSSLMKRKHARLCIIRLCATMLLRSYIDHDDC